MFSGCQKRPFDSLVDGGGSSRCGSVRAGSESPLDFHSLPAPRFACPRHYHGAVLQISGLKHSSRQSRPRILRILAFPQILLERQAVPAAKSARQRFFLQKIGFSYEKISPKSPFTPPTSIFLAVLLRYFDKQISAPEWGRGFVFYARLSSEFRMKSRNSICSGERYFFLLTK